MPGSLGIGCDVMDPRDLDLVAHATMQVGWFPQIQREL